jgi:deoxyguanosine kinase
MTTAWYAIEGLIGAGKSTTATLAASALGMCAALEQADTHPFLARYYRDPQRFALETELAFMAIHLHQVKRTSGSIVSDFSPAKNLIFGECRLGDHDMGTLREISKLIWRDLLQPSVAFFLDVPVDICLERIQRRALPFERSITLRDLEALREGYVANFSELGVDVVRIALTGHESPERVAEDVTARIGTIRT